MTTSSQMRCTISVMSRRKSSERVREGSCESEVPCEMIVAAYLYVVLATTTLSTFWPPSRGCCRSSRSAMS